MKCANCPLFTSWNNESDSGEACGLFGDGWDSPFQYEDKEGTIVGCYIDRHYIEQTDERYMKHLEECVERFKAEEAKGEYDWLKEKKRKNMSWAWTRTFYASRNGIIFNFEAKRQRDDAVKHHGFEKMLSVDAMKHYPNIVRVGWREYGEFIDAAPIIIEEGEGE